jgi:hypothetical protein
VGFALQLGLAIEGNLQKNFDDTSYLVLVANKTAATRMAEHGKGLLRADVLAAGLGQRVANAWRANVYPGGAKLAHNPAVVIFTNAPLIISAFEDGVTIRHKQGLMLAIPTENVPRGSASRGSRNKLTPLEVEARFDQDLILKKSPSGRSTLAFVDVIKARSGSGFRKKTKGRLKQGRKPQLVLMFVLVPQVHLEKRLNYRSIFSTLIEEWPQIQAEELERAFSKVA